MGSMTTLGVSLSFVFGFILLCLVAELYYMLRKKITRREVTGQSLYGELLYVFRFKKADSPTSYELGELSVETSDGDGDVETGSAKDVLLKDFGEMGVDAELMRLQNLCGPPRFLGTIKEETREDLESEDAKSRGGEVFTASSTPYLTPISSPAVKGQRHTVETYFCHGLNPLFESSTETVSFWPKQSPPPSFKFMRDAEEKLMRRLLEEAERKAALVISPDRCAVKAVFAVESPVEADLHKPYLSPQFSCVSSPVKIQSASPSPPPSAPS